MRTKPLASQPASLQLQLALAPADRSKDANVPSLYQTNTAPPFRPAGGTFWGLFLLAAFGPAALIPIPFGVGYLVTAGYIVRSVIVPPLGVRYLI